MFSSTIIPQSVQTAEPEGPRDSMEVEPQLGQRGAFGVAFSEFWGLVDSLFWLSGADSSFQKLSSKFQRDDMMSEMGGVVNEASDRWRLLHHEP